MSTVQNALFSGVSGLNTYSSAISIIGNNIANVNTPGFKEGRLHFGDIMSRSGGGGRVEIGRGALALESETLFNQGGFQTSSRNSDLAIDGQGFFIVKDPATQGLFYTRTGNFTLNKDGLLVNSEGFALQGFPVDSKGNALQFVSDVNIRPSTNDVDISGRAFPPRITQSATIEMNFNSETTLLEDPATGAIVPFDASDPASTSNASTALSIFDSLGNAHNSELYFRKTGTNTWEWHITTPETGLSGAGVSGNGFVEVARGQMTFTDTGFLDTVTTTDRIDYSTGTLTALAQPEQGVAAIFDFEGAQTGQPVTYDIGIPQQTFDSASGTFIANPASTGARGSTQFAVPSATLFQSQDGFGSGVLETFNIDPQGVVQGVFSNGQSLELMHLALAKFTNPEGLSSGGNGLFSATIESGEPIAAIPQSGGLGSIVSNALEISNVDLATQFVELIRAQQAFQANARIITTGNELLTEAVI